MVHVPNLITRHTFVVMLSALIVCGMAHAGETSRFREASYQPNIAQREGLALLRIVGSPAALITEGCQTYQEYSAAAGRSEPLSFFAGNIIGSFVMGFEVLGGTVELVSFHQVKTWPYPWEFDDPDPESIKQFREDIAKESSGGGDFLSEALGAAAGAAAGAAVDHAVNKGRGGGGAYVASALHSGGGCGGSSVKPRVRHSSCRGTGDCPVCRGRGSVGKGIKCTGCGGTTRCRACRGTGYAN